MLTNTVVIPTEESLPQEIEEWILLETTAAKLAEREEVVHVVIVVKARLRNVVLYKKVRTTFGISQPLLEEL